MKSFTTLLLVLVGILRADSVIRGTHISSSDGHSEAAELANLTTAIEEAERESCQLRSSDPSDPCNGNHFPKNHNSGIISDLFDRDHKTRYLEADYEHLDTSMTSHGRSLSSHKVWMIDEILFIDHRGARSLPNAFGLLKLIDQSSEHIEARFIVNNEINFRLTRQIDSSNEESEELNPEKNTKDEIEKNKTTNLTSTAHSTGISPYVHKAWRVQVLNRTNFNGVPTNVLIEEKLQQNLLFNDAVVDLDIAVNGRNIPNILMSTTNQKGEIMSIRLVPLPHIFPVIPSLHTIEGYWEKSIPSSDGMRLKVALSITRITGRLYLLVVEGINIHHTIVSVGRSGDVTLDAISSTTLVPDNEELGMIETLLIENISLSTHLSTEQLPMNSSNELMDSLQAHSDGYISDSPIQVVPTLRFSNTNDSGRPPLEFTRPVNGANERQFRQIPKSQWIWIPESLTVHSNNIQNDDDIDRTRHWMDVSALDVPVRLDLYSHDHAVMIDVFVGQCSHLRAVGVSTSTMPHDIIRSVVEMPPPVRGQDKQPDKDEIEVTKLIHSILKEFDVPDIDASGSFMSLVGRHLSISFQAAQVPSAGLWILEPRGSMVAGQYLTSASSHHRARLGIARREGQLRATLHGDAVLAEFLIENVSDKASEFEWKVQQLAARRVPNPNPDSVAEYENLDQVLSQFFHDGVRVDIERTMDASLLIFTNDRHDSLLFLHPLDLTIGLLGEWGLSHVTLKNGDRFSSNDKETTEHSEPGINHISLELRPQGVGELYGKLKTSRSTYGVELREILSNPSAIGSSYFGKHQKVEKHMEEQDLFIPELWSIDLMKISNHLTGEILQEHLHGSKTNEDRIVKMVESCKQVHLQVNSTKLDVECEDGELHFIRRLEKRIRNLIVGNWTIEFGTRSIEDLNIENVLGLVTTDPSDSETLQVELEIALEKDISFDYHVHQNSESAESTTFYRGTVTRGSTPQIVAKFIMAVNPFGAVRFVSLQEIDLEKETDRDQDERKLSLESLLLNLMRLSSVPVQELNSENQLMLEVSPSQLLLTDGTSMLALSRTVSPAIVELTILFAGADLEPSIKPHGTLYESALNTGRHGTKMINIVQRRLEAAEKLSDLISLTEDQTGTGQKNTQA